jgi:hypothetical protein
MATLPEFGVPLRALDRAYILLKIEKVKRATGL